MEKITVQKVDHSYIQNSIFDYQAGNIDKLVCLILEYPAKDYFPALYETLQSETFRNGLNRHLIFVGITIEFIKYSENYFTLKES